MLGAASEINFPKTAIQSLEYLNCNALQDRLTKRDMSNIVLVIHRPCHFQIDYPTRKIDWLSCFSSDLHLLQISPIGFSSLASQFQPIRWNMTTRFTNSLARWAHVSWARF